MPATIDFNCDLGEGCGQDAAILPFISSASLACGFHAGDPSTLRDAIAACLAAGVAIGAHPSHADREHFGRVERDLPPDDLHALVLFQIGATAALVRATGGCLAHVKPHGALYNQAARSPAVAEAIVRAVRDFDPSLRLYGLAGSALTAAGESAGLRVVHEVFAERRYSSDGSLVRRGAPGAVIEAIDASLAQVREMVRDGCVTTVDGSRRSIRADSLCLHGDRPDAPAFARALRDALESEGIRVQAPG